MSLHLNDWQKDFVYLDGQLVHKDKVVGPLKDGQVLRIPMMMMDGKSKATDAEVIAAANAVKYGPMVDARTGHTSRYATYSADQMKQIEDGVQSYRKRVTDAWKQEPPAVVADASKLTATMGALGALATENAFKAATAAGDPLELEQARARADARLRDAWRNPV